MTQTLLAMLLAAGAAAAPAWEVPRPEVPKGTVEAFTIDAWPGGARKVWVYVPPGARARDAAPLKLLVCFDGDAYLGEIPLPTILDNLVAARRLEPTLAVLVDTSADRLGDLANRRAFADRLADTLVPWVRARWPVSHAAADATVTGSSAGGLAAVFVAFVHPELFGNAVSQSGAFWRGPEGATSDGEWLTRQVASSPRRSVRLVLEVGDRETRPTVGGISMLDANRHLRDALRAKGYPVVYREVPGGFHAPESWRTALGGALAALDTAGPEGNTMRTP